MPLTRRYLGCLIPLILSACASSAISATPEPIICPKESEEFILLGEQIKTDWATYHTNRWRMYEIYDTEEVHNAIALQNTEKLEQILERMRKCTR
jgi:hypothetical protein